MLWWWVVFMLTVWHATPFPAVLILSWLLFALISCVSGASWFLHRFFVPENIYFYLVIVVHHLGLINYIFSSGCAGNMFSVVCFWFFFASSFTLMITYLDLSNMSVFCTSYQLQKVFSCCIYPEKKKQWLILCAMDGSVTHKFKHILSINY